MYRVSHEAYIKYFYKGMNVYVKQVNSCNIVTRMRYKFGHVFQITSPYDTRNSDIKRLFEGCYGGEGRREKQLTLLINQLVGFVGFSAR